MRTVAKLDNYINETEEPPPHVLLGASSRAFFEQHNISQTVSPRFYQHLCAPFPHEPTRDKFKIMHTDAVGEGVISLVDFSPGDVVFSFTGTHLPYQTLFTLQIEPGKYIEDPLVMGKVLHSCDPNIVCSMEHLTFWAIKPIRANDYLFMDYESTEDKLFRSFQCCCGAEACRGTIRGRQYLTEQQRANIYSLSDEDYVAAF